MEAPPQLLAKWQGDRIAPSHNFLADAWVFFSRIVQLDTYFKLFTSVEPSTFGR
jgi:hypothetical protein